MPKTTVDITRDSKNAAGTPIARPTSGVADALREHALGHRRRFRAEREANADLALALAHAVGDDPVDADQPEQQPRAGEDREQEAQETRAAERAGDHRGVRLQFRDRHNRIDLKRRLPHRRGDLFGWSLRCAPPSPSGT